MLLILLWLFYESNTATKVIIYCSLNQTADSSGKIYVGRMLLHSVLLLFTSLKPQHGFNCFKFCVDVFRWILTNYVKIWVLLIIFRELFSTPFLKPLHRF